MAEKIIEHSAIRMYEEDQSKYSIVVDRRRAIPEVRDGLKPVQRRILFAAYRDHLLGPKDKDKSASLCGTVMKYYHPHSSSYDSIVSLVAWYKIKYPLMYGKGNWGNASGAGAASERYTETALSDFGYDVMIDELYQSNNIVDWIDTYKRNGDKEPEFLPAKVPLLLINGSFGIGVGLQISVPSHNIVDVLEATKKLIKNPKADVVLIPDLPQACEIIDTDWKSICNSGTGTFKVRGKITTEQNPKNGAYKLHIVSLPDMVTATKVYDQIMKMVADKELPMVKDVFNSLNGIYPDIIIELRPGSDPNYVKEIIYSKTSAMVNMSVNFEAVAPNGIDIIRYSYKKYLLTFIDQRMNIKFRLYCNKLQQVLTKHYQVDAFVRVLESGQIDKIIQLIRKSKGTDDDIVEKIIKLCKMSDIQAKFIINCQLSRLSAAHLASYKATRKDLESQIALYKKIVTDNGDMIRDEIYNELTELEKKYGTPRLCTVIDAKHENEIPGGMFKIVITEKNYIRKIPDTDRVNIIKKDNPKFVIRIDNRENVLLFDNKGKVFNLPVSKIPITDKSGMGTDIRILVKNLTADIISIFAEDIFKAASKFKRKHYMVVLTKSNTIKKLDIEDFLNISPSGLMYSKIKPEDEVVGVSLIPHDLDIAVSSGKKVLRFKMTDVPLVKRNSIGSKAINTTDPVNGLSVIYPDAKYIVVVTKNGKFNKFDSNLLASHSRGKKGSTVIKLDGNDEIFNIFGVNDTDHIRLVTSDGIQEVLVSDIKLKSSIAAGTPMFPKTVIIRADVIR